MPALDLVLVVSERNRGWVLDTICRQIEGHYPGRARVHYGIRSLPAASAFFFSHYSLFGACLRRNPLLRLRRTLVFFTHPSHTREEGRKVARRLAQASAVVSMSSIHAERLVGDGVPAAKVHVVIPGTDSVRFQPHPRDGAGAVGFCSAYYQRKDPDRLAAIVAAMPNRRFLLVGKGWPEWSGFSELSGRPNFAYAEPAYDDYPAQYGAMDVLVSASRLEGGPIPLLEAMMSNVVPVCSRTGFAPDIVDHGVNGFIFDIDAPVAEICELVELAYRLETDVRATVVDRTWERFSAEIHAIAEAPLTSMRARFSARPG